MAAIGIAAHPARRQPKKRMRLWAKGMDDRHSGMVRQHQTRNLEIPGSMLRIAPE
jgi:hypothetical protein